MIKFMIAHVGRQVCTLFIFYCGQTTRQVLRSKYYIWLPATKLCKSTVQRFVCLFKGLPVPDCWLTVLESPRIKVLRCKGTQRAADLFSLSRSAVPVAIFFTDPDWTGLCLKLIKRCTTRRAKIFLKKISLPYSSSWKLLDFLGLRSIITSELMSQGAFVCQIVRYSTFEIKLTFYIFHFQSNIK